MQKQGMATKAGARKAPGQLKAKLAMAAFVAVAAISLTLTSAGLVYAVTQTSVPAIQLANVTVPLAEVLR